MSGDAIQDATVARVKDLEQALECHRHMLKKTTAERDELQRAVEHALIEHSRIESARARLAQENERLSGQLGEFAQANTGLGVALLEAQGERDDARAELAALQGDLRRVTEERNAARESRRAMEFELTLLRDGPQQPAPAAAEASR